MLAIMSASVYIVVEVNRLGGDQSPVWFWIGLIGTAIGFGIGAVLFVADD